MRNFHVALFSFLGVWPDSEKVSLKAYHESSRFLNKGGSFTFPILVYADATIYGRFL